MPGIKICLKNNKASLMQPVNSDILLYYQDRAREYEKIYTRPERLDDLLRVSLYLQHVFAGRNVIEIACGTGYWTEVLQRTAQFIEASDINESVIDVARKKRLPADKVHFEVADLYTMEPKQLCDSLFGGFILSHVLRQDCTAFFDRIGELLPSGSQVVMADNRYVEGSNHPVAETDALGNTYQLRKLEDGSQHRVLKNFYDAKFLREKLHGRAVDVEFRSLKYFWVLTYRTI